MPGPGIYIGPPISNRRYDNSTDIRWTENPTRNSILLQSAAGALNYDRHRYAVKNTSFSPIVPEQTEYCLNVTPDAIEIAIKRESER